MNRQYDPKLVGSVALWTLLILAVCGLCSLIAFFLS